MADPGFMYRAVEAPNLLEQFAPVIGQLLLGMSQPMRVPSLPPGVSPFEALYAQRVTTPQWAYAQQEAVKRFAGGVSGDIGKTLTNFGMHRMFNTTAKEFQSALAEKGSSATSLAILDQIAQQPFVTNLMGGDLVAAEQTLFAGRHALGRIPGMVVSPLDTSGAQERILAHQMQLSDAVQRAAYADPRTGEMSLRPNYDYTRGFRVEELATMGRAMAERGDQGMMDIRVDPRAKAMQIGQMARTMEALSEVIGSRDMNALFSSLEKLTNNQWPNINKQALEHSFRQITATAQVMNMAPQQVMEQVSMIQDTMQRAVGVTPQQQLYGITAGGYGSLPFAQRVTDQVMAVAHMTGRTDPYELQQVRAQQSALMGAGLQSKQGRDLQMIQWLQEQGQIDPADYAKVQQSLVSGSKEQQQSVVNEVYRRAFGSDAEGRRLASDPEFMSMVRAATSPAGAALVADSIVQAQGLEHRQRMHENIVNDMFRGNREMVRRGAQPVDPGVRADRQLQVTTEYFRSKDDMQTAEMLQGVYNRTLEQSQDAIATGRMTEAQAKTRAMGAVNATVTGMTHLRGEMPELRRRQREASVVATSEALTDPEAEAGVRANAELQALRGLQGQDLDARRRLTTIATIKDPAERQRAMDEFKQTLSPTQVETVNRSVEAAVGQFRGVQDAGRAAATRLRRQATGEAAGMSQKEIEDEQAGLNFMLNNVLRAGTDKEAQIAFVENAPVQYVGTEEKRKAMIEGIRTGDMTAIKAGAARFIRGMQTVSDDPTIGERKKLLDAVEGFGTKEAQAEVARLSGVDNVLRDVGLNRISREEGLRQVAVLPQDSPVRQKAEAALKSLQPLPPGPAEFALGAQRGLVTELVRAGSGIEQEATAKRIEDDPRRFGLTQDRATQIATAIRQANIDPLAQATAQRGGLARLMEQVGRGEAGSADDAVKQLDAFTTLDADTRKRAEAAIRGGSDAARQFGAQQRNVQRVLEAQIGTGGFRPDEAVKSLEAIGLGAEDTKQLTTLVKGYKADNLNPIFQEEMKIGKILEDATFGFQTPKKAVEQISALNIPAERKAKLIETAKDIAPIKTVSGMQTDQQKLVSALELAQKGDVAEATKQIEANTGISLRRKEELVGLVQAPVKSPDVLQRLDMATRQEQLVLDTLNKAAGKTPEQQAAIVKDFQDLPNVRPETRQQVIGAIQRQALEDAGKPVGGGVADRGTLADMAKQERITMLQTFGSEAAFNKQWGSARAIEERGAAQRTLGDIMFERMGVATLGKQLSDTSQGLRASLPQLALAFAVGDVDLPRVLGLQEGDPKKLEEMVKDKALRERVEAIRDSAEGKRMQTATDDMSKARKRMETAVSDIREMRTSDKPGEAFAAQSTQTAVSAAQAAIRSSGTVDEKQLAGTREQLEKTLGGITGLSVESRTKLLKGFDDTIVATKDFQTARGGFVEAAKGLEGPGAKDPTLLADLEQNARYNQWKSRIEKRKDIEERKEQDVTFKQLGGGALFASDLAKSWDKLSREDRKTAEAALDALKSAGVPLKTGHEVSTIFGEVPDNDPKNRLEQLGKTVYTDEQLKGMTTEQRKAVQRLGDVYLKTQEPEEDKTGEKKTSGKRGGKGGGQLKLSGVLLLKTGRGRTVGTLDASQVSGDLDGGD